MKYNCKYTTAGDMVCETSARTVNVWLTLEKQGNHLMGIAKVSKKIKRTHLDFQNAWLPLH